MADANNLYGDRDGATFGQKLVNAVFEYQTLKIVNIGNKRVGALNRIIQLTIISYIVGYALIYKKGYQEFSTFNSATTSKVKGIISTEDLKDSDFLPKIANKDAYRRVWDVPDIVVPPSESDAFFLTSNTVITNQSVGICPEAVIPSAKCKDDSNCHDGMLDQLGNGVQTGICVKATDRPDEKNMTCQIRGWCPVEEDIGPLMDQKPLLTGIENFTVLLKNYIEFPLFKIKLRNIKASQNKSYLNNCNYDPDKHPQCPVFKISEIVEAAEANFTDLAGKGGVINIVINWDCNLDYNEKYCIPTYRFMRIDDPDVKLGKGWNFRYANYYSTNNRTLKKAYGITFRISVQGRAGRFSVVPIILTIGSGLGLLVVAAVICDFVVVHCMSNRALYKKNKFRFVESSYDNGNYEDSVNRTL